MTCKGYFYSVYVLDLYQLMSPSSFRYQALWHYFYHVLLNITKFEWIIFRHVNNSTANIGLLNLSY